LDLLGADVEGLLKDLHRLAAPVVEKAPDAATAGGREEQHLARTGTVGQEEKELLRVRTCKPLLLVHGAPPLPDCTARLRAHHSSNLGFCDRRTPEKQDTAGQGSGGVRQWTRTWRSRVR